MSYGPNDRFTYLRWTPWRSGGWRLEAKDLLDILDLLDGFAELASHAPHRRLWGRLGRLLMAAIVLVQWGNLEYLIRVLRPLCIRIAIIA